MGVTTVVIAGIPQYVTLTDVACNLDNLFSGALNEVGDFHLRDLPNNSYTNARQIAVDFDSSYSAIVAQKILDEYKYVLPNGKQYILQADIMRTKLSVREIDKSSASPSPEKITYKKRNHRDERMNLISKRHQSESLHYQNESEIEKKLVVLKKQKKLLAMQRQVLKEKKKLKREMEDFECSDSEESSLEGYERSARRKRSRSRSRHERCSSSSTSESSDEEVYHRKHSGQRYDRERSSKHHRKHKRSRSRCRSKEKSRKRRSRHRSSSLRRRKSRSQSWDRNYKRLQKEFGRYDGNDIILGVRSDFSPAPSRKHRRSRSPHRSKERSQSSLRLDNKYSQSMSYKNSKERNSPEESSSCVVYDRRLSKVSRAHYDSYEEPSSSKRDLYETAAKLLMRDTIQIMFYQIVMNDKIKLPPKDFKALYKILTNTLVKRLQNLPVIAHESVSNIFKCYNDYYDTNDNLAMLRNILNNFRSNTIIIDDEEEIPLVKSSRTIIDESTSRKRYKRSSDTTYTSSRDDAETDSLVLGEEQEQQIVPYCPNLSLQKRIKDSEPKEAIIDSPLLPAFVPCNPVDNEEKIDREIPINPRFVLPTRVILKQMRFILSDLGFDDDEVNTKVLRRVIRRELRTIMAGKEYMNTGSIVRLFRQHHPKEDDKVFLQNILDNIKAGTYLDEDSDTGEACSETKTVPAQAIENENTNHENVESKDMANSKEQTNQNRSNDNSKIIHANLINSSNDDKINVPKCDSSQNDTDDIICDSSHNNTKENKSNDIIEIKDPGIANGIGARHDIELKNELKISKNDLNDTKGTAKLNQQIAVEANQADSELPVKVFLKEIEDPVIANDIEGRHDIELNNESKISKNYLNDTKGSVKINQQSAVEANQADSELPVKKLLKEMKKHLKNVDKSKLDEIKLVIRAQLQKLTQDRKDLNCKTAVSLFRECHPKDSDNIFILNIVNSLTSRKIKNDNGYAETEVVGKTPLNDDMIKDKLENTNQTEGTKVLNEKEIKPELNSKVKCNEKEYINKLSGNQEDTKGNLNELALRLETKVKGDKEESFDGKLTEADVTGEILNEIAADLRDKAKDDDNLSILTVTFNTVQEYNRSTEDLLKVLTDD